MAVHASHAALPYPIKNARFSFLVPYLDADGDPTDPTTPDTEVSGDNGAYADCAEEVSTATGSNGTALMTLTGAETNYSTVGVAAKVASGPKATLATLYPRVLAIVGSGTLSAGSAGGGTLGTILAYDVTGCFIRTTGGTGGGGTGGANNQARKIITYTVSTGGFTVSPNWETTPSTDTTYDVLLPDGLTLGALRALNPTTAGRTLDVSTGGEAGLDWANVGSPTTTVNLSGTSTKAVEPTVAGRTLDVSSTGEAGIDWANIGSPTTAQTLSGTSTKALEPTTAGRTLDVAVSGEAGIDMTNILLTNGALAAGILASGTLNGTHTTTTADLGTNAPTWNIAGSLLVVEAAGLMQVVDSYNTGTGVATFFTALGSAPTNGQQWYLFIGGQSTAAALRAAIGMASANMDTQLSGITGRLPAALVSGRIDATVGNYQSGLAPLQPTVTGRTLDVSATGEAGVDWANVGSAGTAVNLTGTTILTASNVETDTQDIQARLPAALVSGRMSSQVVAVNTDALNAAALATDAVTEIVSAVLDTVIDGTLTLRTSMRLQNSAMFAKVSGAETSTIVFRDAGDTKARITATVDDDGNRLAVTVDAT